jgi:hypothetical protein
MKVRDDPEIAAAKLNIVSTFSMKMPPSISIV